MKQLICYSATWCGPCKMLKPTLNKLIEEGLNIKIVQIDEGGDEEGLSKGISVVPTFILYEDGVELGRAEGVPIVEDIRTWLE